VLPAICGVFAQWKASQRDHPPSMLFAARAVALVSPLCWIRTILVRRKFLQSAASDHSPACTKTGEGKVCANERSFSGVRRRVSLRALGSLHQRIFGGSPSSASLPRFDCASRVGRRGQRRRFGLEIRRTGVDEMKIRMYRLALFAASASLLALIGCGGGAKKEAAAPPAPLAPAVDPATAASITGKVSYEGALPVAHVIDMSATPACMRANPKGVLATTVLRSANGGLANVVVYVKSGLGHYRYPAPQTPVVLDQKNCMYAPRVVGLMVDQPFEVENHDLTMHNVVVMPRNNPRWGTTQPVGSAPVKSKFEDPEFAMPVICDIHPWMRAYVFVFDQPYFDVTSKDGAFALKDLPPGTYTIEAWHEGNKTLDQTITLGPKESKSISFTFRANAQS
jgi:hypothetical protein